LASKKTKASEKISVPQPQKELLHVAEAVAREKNIDKNEVLDAMEKAFQIAAKHKYGHEYDIRAEINQETGNVRLFRVITVVEEVKQDLKQISLERARRYDETKQIGDEITEELPSIDFGRVAAQTARQDVVKKLKHAERARLYSEYKDRVGDIVMGTVKNIEFGNVIVDIGTTEAVIKRENTIAKEVFRVGDRVQAVIAELNDPEARGHLLILSRTDNRFLEALLKKGIPEINDGSVKVKAVSRDPGSRAKIAVYSEDRSFDPVGSCIGVKGSRIQPIIAELQGEKIDVVLWSDDVAKFVVNALSPVQITSIVKDEEQNSVEVIVPESELSLAIGRRGQNIKLAAKLTGLKIDVTSAEKHKIQKAKSVSSIAQALDIDDEIAHLLIGNGFLSVEEIATADYNDLESVFGDFDHRELIEELQARANNYLILSRKKVEDECRNLGMTGELVEFLGRNNISDVLYRPIVDAGIKTLDDLADLDTDELFAIFSKHEHIAKKEVGEIIMKAREHWHL